MKLVYTLYVAEDPTINGKFCGYNSSEDLFNMLLLSSISSGKHFDKCELYCNRRGYEMLKKDGRPFPFTDVIALSNNIGIAIVAKRLHEKLYDHYKLETSLLNNL